MSSAPSDDELENSAADRTEAAGETASELSDLGDNVDDAADLAGEAGDHNAQLRGMFGALLDQDTNFFNYSSEAMSNLNDTMRAHVASLAGLHDKVDRNRREVLALGATAAVGYDWINASSEDEPGTGPISMGGADIDGYGMIGEQGGVAGSVEQEGYLDRSTLEITREEAGDYFRTFLNENQWNYGTDGEGTDIAGVKVENEDGDFSYTMAHVNIARIENDSWKNADSVGELLEDYSNDSVEITEGSLDEDLGEYMLDASRSENPEQLDFDNYLED